MARISAPAGYASTAKFLHWLIAALLVVQFIIAWTMPHIGRNTPVTTSISLHFSLGIFVLAVAAIRLVRRVTHSEPAPEAGVPPWQVQSARVVHWLLYLLLFVVPMLGWINASWRGMPVTLFGLFEVPKLLEKHASGWAWSGDIHSLLANYAILGVLGLHVATALYHHFIRRDGVLRRMLPGEVSQLSRSLPRDRSET